MRTPLLLLSVLVVPYMGIAAIEAVRGRRFEAGLRGCAGLTLLLLMTGSSHFANTEAMIGMLPAWVPARPALVGATGVLEILLGLAVLIPRTRRAAALVLIALFVALFPANVWAAFNRVPVGGHAWGPVYLLVRAPLQAIFIWWTYRFAVRTPTV
jgi:uncharacterized membrane protein